MYTPNQQAVYLAAFNGASAGLVSAGRFPVSTASASYSGNALVAGAFAQQLDTLWGATTPTTAQVAMIGALAEGLMSNRSTLTTPTASDTNPLTYSAVCTALIASVTAATTYLGTQSIAPLPSVTPSAYVIFRPGGTASPGVYVTEAALSAALAGLQAPTIFFDGSISGTYFFTTVGQLDLGLNAIWTDEGHGYVFGFSHGTTLAHPPNVIRGSIAIATSQASPVCTLTAGAFDLFIEGNSLVQQFGVSQGTFISTTGTSTLQVFIRDFARISNNGSATVGVFDATSAGSVVKLYSEGGNGLSSFALTPNPSGSGGKGTTAIVVIGVLTFYSVALLPLMVVEGLLIDSSGTAVGLIPPATSFGLIIQSGTYWWSNAGPAWTPITPLKGRTTLVGGHSPVVAVAYMDANTRITLGRSAVNASTTLGELAALETERVNGAPGSFRISALQDATPGSLQAGDVSDVDYFVSN